MTDRELDGKFGEDRPVDPRLMETIAANVLSNVVPVRPMPARAAIEAQLIAAAAVIAFAGASRIGFYAIHRLSGTESAVIFSGLAALLWLAAGVATAAIVPGARQRLRPLSFIAVACAALVAIFAIVFHDYSTAPFVRQGIGCLKAGLTDAVPAGLAVWLLLRRGFAVSTVAAGAAAGALAGLAGVLMLELHCPIFKAPHVMVWHVAVIPLSGAVGAVLGRVRALSS